MQKITILRRKWPWILVMAFVALSLFGFIGWSVFVYLRPTATLSHRESALQQTQQLLSFVENHPNGFMPDSLSGHLRVNSVCWTFLQKGMMSNVNQYKLTVTSEYDSQTNPKAVHDLVEVWLNIDFPNGQRAEMYYSQGGLTGCHGMQ